METENLLEKGLKLIYVAAMIWLIFAAFNMFLRGNYFNFSFGDNILEEATKVGVSTRSDFDEFQREGGLETKNIWNDFYVESIKTSYDNNDTLQSVTFSLDKKGYANLYGSIDANYSNVVESLDAYCGSDWVKQSEIEQVYEARNEGNYCKYEYPPSSSSVFVTISKEEDRSGAAASLMSDTPRSVQFQTDPTPEKGGEYRAALANETQAATAADAALAAAAEVAAEAEGF